MDKYERKDLEEQQSNFSYSVWINEMVNAIDSIVGPIVEHYTSIGKRLEIDIILVNKDLEKPAEIVAAAYGLKIETSIFLPNNEVFVTSNDKVEGVIKSRYVKSV